MWNTCFPHLIPPYQTICLLRETCIFLFVNMFPIPDKTLKACFLYQTFPIPNNISYTGQYFPYQTKCPIWGIQCGKHVRYRKHDSHTRQSHCPVWGDWCVPDVRCERTDCTCCKGWSINLVGFSFL